MITSKLIGGLGNQLFQILNAISYGIKHNEPFIFIYSNQMQTDNPRPYYWDTLLFKLKKYTNYDGIIPNAALESFTVYNGDHGYTPIPMIYDINTSFNGYFQSYRYFEKYYSHIYNLLNIEQMKSNLELKPFVPDENAPTISMHFRLGDYTHKQCYHPVLPILYYERSIRHIIKKDPRAVKSRIFVFFEENNVDYVNKMVDDLSNIIPTVSFVLIEEKCDWKQMLLMSKCDHHIIANSTFSWWGATFSSSNIDINAVTDSRYPKIICYPSIWHGHLLYYINTSELFHPSWSKITIYHSEMDNSHCMCAAL